MPPATITQLAWTLKIPSCACVKLASLETGERVTVGTRGIINIFPNTRVIFN